MAMKTTTNRQIEAALQQMSEKAVLARQELDELALQLSLGKAEAKDKFEEIKKGFRVKLNELRRIIQADSKENAGKDLISKIVALETILFADRADSPHAFNTQRRVLATHISKLQEVIARRFSSVPAIHEFVYEIEILRLKLEVLRLKFAVRKFKIKNSFRAGMDKAVGVVHAAESKVRNTRDRYRNFRDEIGLAYEHMRKAIKSM
jgi:hypothetical protein